MEMKNLVCLQFMDILVKRTMEKHMEDLVTVNFESPKYRPLSKQKQVSSRP